MCTDLHINKHLTHAELEVIKSFGSEEEPVIFAIVGDVSSDGKYSPSTIAVTKSEIIVFDLDNSEVTAERTKLSDIKKLYAKLCVSHDGNYAKIIVFTNANEAELFCGNQSLGVKEAVHNKAEWVLPLAEEFTVTVKRGSESFTDKYKMHGDFYSLIAEDVTPPSAGNGARIVNIKAVDKNGSVISDLYKNVIISLSQGRILGVGNGDPNAHFNCRAKEFPLFGGLGQVILTPDYADLTVTLK